MERDLGLFWRVFSLPENLVWRGAGLGSLPVAGVCGGGSELPTSSWLIFWPVQRGSVQLGLTPALRPIRCIISVKCCHCLNLYTRWLHQLPFINVVRKTQLLFGIVCRKMLCPFIKPVVQRSGCGTLQTNGKCEAPQASLEMPWLVLSTSRAWRGLGQAGADVGSGGRWPRG